jgi:SAM-dependent methyltransferase
MSAPCSPEAIRDVNVRYHDAASGEYDMKWGIDYGALGRRQVVGKLAKALGGRIGPFERSLEIGAGTGYFSLNLLRAGVVREATCTDISPGMLARLERNAAELGLEPEAIRADAEALPFDAARFDVVLGHAVLHHVPDLGRAFAEFARVLARGGALVFAGEPSRRGDRLAAIPKRAALAAAPAWRAALGAAAARNGGGADGGDDLESQVDVHAFDPAELSALAREAGLEDVRVRGEELLANWFGWTTRTLEASAEPADVPRRWRQFAHRGYLALQELDRRLLERRLPAALFYNLILSARKPA